MATITFNEIFAGLRYAEGFRWNGSSLTFSLPGPGESFWASASYDPGSEPFDDDFGVLNAAQRTHFIDALGAWERVINFDIFEVADTQASVGQIRIAFTDTAAQDVADAAAYAYTPPQPGFSAGASNGDIWIDKEYKGESAAPGTYFYSTLLHEIGHALGLKHPFEGALLPAAFDSTRYTVMSYNDIEDGSFRFFVLEGTTLFANTTFVNPTTPMILDIAAIQGIYGASNSVATGANTYTFDTTRPLLETVIDNGGIDTFDLSTHTRPSNVSLVPGTLSSIGFLSIASQIAFYQAAFPNFSPSFIASYLDKPDTYTWSNNVGISFDSMIENVLGGSGSDTITGNIANNSLMAGAGNDSVAAGAGADTVNGGAGGGYLRGDDGNDSILAVSGFNDINGNMGNDTIQGGLGDDWVVGGRDQDLIFGGAGANLVYGNLGDDTLDGGGGNDIVRGGQGNDTVAGGAGADFVSGDLGNDTMAGGSGADIFSSFATTGMDRVIDFNVAEGDRVMLAAGTAFTLEQMGADTVIMMSGGMVVLAGVSMSSLLPTSIFGT